MLLPNTTNLINQNTLFYTIQRRVTGRNLDPNSRDCAVALILCVKTLILCVKTLILCVNAGASAWHPRCTARRQEASGRQEFGFQRRVEIALILCVNAGASAWRQEASDRQEFGCQQ